MNKDIKEAIKILISTLLIFISFFVWYLFWDQKNKAQIKILKEKKHYIKIEKLKTKLNLYPWKNVIIINNWKEHSSWNLILD